MNARTFLATFRDCPWMATNMEYAEAIASADTKELEALSAFGKKHGPFVEKHEVPTPTKMAEVLKGLGELDTE